MLLPVLTNIKPFLNILITTTNDWKAKCCVRNCLCASTDTALGAADQRVLKFLHPKPIIMT